MRAKGGGFVPQWGVFMFCCVCVRAAMSRRLCPRRRACAARSEWQASSGRDSGGASADTKGAKKDKQGGDREG